MSTQDLLDANEDLDSVAFAIEVTKGEGYTTTTTTPPPPVVVKAADCIKYAYILLGLFFTLLFLQANRMLTIFVIGVAGMSILSYLHVRPAANIIVSWLKLDYIFELIFVMLLIAITADTGFYDVLGYYLCRGLKCNIFAITFILCFATFVVAVIMDNVAAILFMTPIAIRTIEEGQMNPVPVLMSMILYCNMAGVLNTDYNYVNSALMKGPERWQATDNAFRDVSFPWKMFPGVMLVACLTAVYLVIVFALLKPHKYTMPEISVLVHRQILLRIAASGINRQSKHWLRVRNKLIQWHQEIDQERLSKLTELHPPRQVERPRFNRIKDVCLLIKVAVVVVFLIILFFLRRNKLFGLGEVSVGWIVVISMGYLLIFVNPPDLNLILWRIEWSTIISFISLFFLERVFDTMRLNRRVFDYLKTQGFPASSSPDYQNNMLSLAIKYMFWGSFLLSSICSNFSATTTLRLVGTAFGDLVHISRIGYIVWAITFGANVGGSATLLGTGVAIACCASAWQQGYKVTSCRYLIFMLPITIINMCGLYVFWHFVKVSEGINTS